MSDPYAPIDERSQTWVAPAEWPHCTGCGQPVNPAALAGGFTTHPSCWQGR